jgi:hypothetical protein
MMIELKNDELVFSFPEIHKDAVLRVGFQRTLRIPDDDKEHFLPPGLGKFPVRHVDDFEQKIPASWSKHGGVMLPMYQSEAMWLSFSSSLDYPFAVKVAAGKINAVTGEPWVNGINREPQDYMQIPGQPWLDGFCVEKGVIRQFVAMPLGSGYSVEEQITGEAEFGGLQIMVYPMKMDAYVKHQRSRNSVMYACCPSSVTESCSVYEGAEMGLAPGGKMRQEIYEDEFRMDEWELSAHSRCFVHLNNSMQWRRVTGKNPPTLPPTAEVYTKHGLPWFDYYSDAPSVPGSDTLAGVKSVRQLGLELGESPLPENHPIGEETVVKINAGKFSDPVL